MKNSTIKPLVIALACVLYWPQTNAEVVNETWIVRSGDGLYNIARKLAPQDLQMQARIRNEIAQLNPGVNINSLEIGISLKLPNFLFQKPEPQAPVKSIEPPAPTQISKAATTPDPEEIVGRVVIQSGNMVAENRGTSRKLNRTSTILKGDTLKTASNTRSQIRLKDGALIALSPDTELKIEDFAFNGSEDGSERSVLNLIKGGFRTITGAIGHINKQNYQVRTSVATIGIRGTHYGLMLCEAGSCQNNPEAGNLSDGLYGGVVDGSIVTENASGVATFNNDQFFHIQTAQTPPIETLLPPPVFQDTSPQMGNKAPAEVANNLDGQRPTGPRPGMVPGQPGGPDNFQFNHNPIVMEFLGGDFLPPKDFQTLPGQQPGDSTNFALPTPAPAGSGIAVAFTGTNAGLVNGGAGSVFIRDNNPNGIYLETITGPNGNVIARLPFAIHEEHDEFDPQTQIFTHVVHDAVRNNPNGTGAVYALTSLGGNPTYGVNWGRWNGNYVLLENGTPVSHDNDFHFIYSENLTPKDTLFNLGGLRGRIDTYSVIGGTLPTDNQGNVAAAGDITQLRNVVNINASFDFVKHIMVDYDLTVANFSNPLIDHLAWSLSTFGPISFSDLGGSFQLLGDSATCPTCYGDASVMFVGNSAEAIMTSYAMYDTNITFPYSLSGVALLAPQSGAVANGSGLMVAGINHLTPAAATPMAFPVLVNLGSQDNIYIGTDINNTQAPIGAIDQYMGADTFSHYHGISVNPSVATATVLDTATTTLSPSALATAVAGGTANVYWGRWDQATVFSDATSINGTTAHFIGSNTLTSPTQLGGLTGSAIYAIANGSTAYDINSNFAVTSVSVAMNVSFDLHQVTAYEVRLSGLLGAINAPVDFAALNQGFNLMDSATCTPCTSRGTASLAFVGPQAEGAITSFSLSDGLNTGAGVAVLTR